MPSSLAGPFLVAQAFSTQLAALVVRAASAEDTAAVLRLLTKPAEAAGWQIAVLEGLGHGSQNSQLCSAGFGTSRPPACRKSSRRYGRSSRGPRKRCATKSALSPSGRPPFGCWPSPRSGSPRRCFSRCWILNSQPISNWRPCALLGLQENSRVADILLESWRSYTPAVRRERSNCSSPARAALIDLLAAIEQNKLAAADVEPSRIEQLQKHPNAKVRERAKAVLQTTAPDRGKVVEEYRSALALKPDANRGKMIFQKVCAMCHRLDNVGVEVGADLVAALGNKTPEKLLLDVFDPSREVDSRYVNYLVTTKNGRVLSGLIAAETASSIMLRRAERAEDTVLRTQIDEVHSTGKLIMPEGLEKQLSQQEFADLIGYLLQGRAK